MQLNYVYINPYELKKHRSIVLEKANWKCQICSGKATEVHHKDHSKDNHSIENLMPVCNKCHKTLHRKKTRPTIDVKKITFLMEQKGLTLEQLADKADVKLLTITRLLERERSSNRILLKISKVLGCFMEELIKEGKPTKNYGAIMKLNEAMEKIIQIKLQNSPPETHEKTKRLVRTWLTAKVRKSVGIRNWQLIDPSNVDIAIKAIEEWAIKHEWLTD